MIHRIKFSLPYARPIGNVKGDDIHYYHMLSAHIPNDYRNIRRMTGAHIRLIGIQLRVVVEGNERFLSGFGV